MLTESDLIRYGRQISYPGFGEGGQRKLKRSHVVVAGLGGLGTASSVYLACGGIGHITIVDGDFVELSNLNRQILYWEGDIGKKKALSAARKLAKLNSSVEITPLFKRITHSNVGGIIEGAHAVIDGMDNFETRFILNSACVGAGIPFIHAGINGLLGEITTIIPGKTPCLACIFPQAPAEDGAITAFGVAPALMAALQVTEALKLLAGFGDLLAGKMLYFNGETMEFTVVDLVRNPECSVCGF
jgi:molybdopterin/thiamine biosynthesis adenylyltransferase